jgi:bifunctional DNase/RNase
MLEVRLSAVRVDLPTNTPVVLLAEINGVRALPIFIGAPEATAIAYALQHVEVPRPMTHDLMKELLEVAGLELERVVVTEVRGGTYFAELRLVRDGVSLTVSSRPSDAVALAARTGTPLFVADELMDEAGIVLEDEAEPNEAGAEGEESSENPDEVVGQFLEFLDQIRPEDFDR